MRKFFGIVAFVAFACLTIPTVAFAQTTVSVDPAELASPAVGEEFSVDIVIAGAANVAGYQITVTFDPTAVAYVSIANADFLPAGAFAVPPIVGADRVTLAATSLAGVANGDGTLATATFTVVEVKESTIGLVGVALSNPAGTPLDHVTANGLITAGAQNEAPTADIQAVSEAAVGDTVSFDGTGSTDDGSIVSYSWDFGDGSGAGAGETIDHVYTAPGEYTVTLTVTDDGGLTGEATHIITISEAAQPVVTEASGAFLWLQANVLESNTTAQCFIPIWEGEMVAEAGTFLEYQVRFLSTSTHRMGGVYVHTASGIFGGVAPEDGDDWVHRKVSLDEIAAQTITAISVGTDNSASPDNESGAFNMMVDNVQITDGTSIITAVWVDQNNVGGEVTLTDTVGDPVGANNCELNVTEGEVAVSPKGKKLTNWGTVKATR